MKLTDGETKLSDGETKTAYGKTKLLGHNDKWVTDVRNFMTTSVD